MRNYQTEKQEKYFEEVIRLHYEKGYGENRIAKVLPIGHTTASRWIAIFASRKGLKSSIMKHKLSQETTGHSSEEADVKALQAKVSHLEKELKIAGIKLDALDEMINVAEAKLKISIRKKAGAKR